ncbi:hypothetical protein Mp_4g10090 [Marchantia polymorpha subsp. ruderalis]|uniref:Uncharacterized protein n=2 Tax=Marchantia polymorpha TaxID=3197 RepID=A0AAF6B8B7_MARPO|nr:hypothetical protein MARPO_0132s0052 [Marchantia polymorpha]BBN08251.1 hypothetical protein Mp_4g10090 [Marchantia polymorpha subsp. ruderalis]|eukprot:PTQ29981.1 hypothetical protein MARPO_0132s0052 [Marchantia polymorpha]
MQREAETKNHTETCYEVKDEGPSGILSADRYPYPDHRTVTFALLIPSDRRKKERLKGERKRKRGAQAEQTRESGAGEEGEGRFADYRADARARETDEGNVEEDAGAGAGGRRAGRGRRADDCAFVGKEGDERRGKERKGKSGGGGVGWRTKAIGLRHSRAGIAGHCVLFRPGGCDMSGKGAAKKGREFWRYRPADLL